MGSRESWRVTGQMVADFARAICEALLASVLVVLLLLWGVLAVGEQVAALLA